MKISVKYFVLAVGP